MSYINTENKENWEADLASTKAQIIAIDVALAGAAIGGILSYSFDSGTGRQSETFNSPLELIKVRKSLSATRDLLIRKLNGTAIVRMQYSR